MLVKEKSIDLYTNNIQLDWTPIEPIIKNITFDKNQSHFITRIQFPIHLVVVRTIHWSQRLSLDKLVFNLTNVNKHALSYKTFSHIQTKEGLYLLIPLQHYFTLINM
jgi:hypothetical protein